MIKLIDATFNDKLNLHHFQKINLAKYFQTGFDGFNWFSSFNIPYYLKEMNLKPNDFFENLKIKPKNTELIANLSSFNLIKNKKFSREIIEKYLNFLSKSNFTSIKVYDPLNDIGTLHSILKLILEGEYNLNVIGGIFVRPEVPEKLMKYSEIIDLYNQFKIDHISLIEPLGLLRPNQIGKIIENTNNFEGSFKSLFLINTPNKTPIIISEALDQDINIFEVSNIISNPNLNLPDVNLLNDLGIDLDINLDLLCELIEPIQKNINFKVPKLTFHNLRNAEFIDKGLNINIIRKIFLLKESLNIKLNHKKIFNELLKVKEELGNPPLVSPFKDMILAQTLFNLLDTSRYGTIPLKTKLYLCQFWGKPVQPVNVTDQKNFDLILNNSKNLVAEFEFGLNDGIFNKEKFEEKNEIEHEIYETMYLLAAEDVVYFLEKKNRPFHDIDFSKRSNIADFVKMILDHNNETEKTIVVGPRMSQDSNSNKWRSYGRMMQMGKFS